ncbi:hypothetical protein NM688_g1408 [Phlebia brevispora]|uniref:Uncharacterized protein n=1 Tax=Phlebia brevispora TaxID=194682 RepID=A0ACC1TB95_9APHY|nr:hypothetical protein NM688_g1408 [Phlebia brevispora]
MIQEDSGLYSRIVSAHPSDSRLVTDYSIRVAMPLTRFFHSHSSHSKYERILEKDALSINGTGTSRLLRVARMFLVEADSRSKNMATLKWKESAPYELSDVPSIVVDSDSDISSSPAFPVPEISVLSPPPVEFPVPLVQQELWRALQRRFASANESTEELIRRIIHLADMQMLDHKLTTMTTQALHVHSSGPHTAQLWFFTRPLSAHDIQNIAAVQLFTASHNQGWVSDRMSTSYSWFELAFVPTLCKSRKVWGLKKVRAWLDVLPQAGEKGSGALKRWHHSHGNPVADDKLTWHKGHVFGRDDELWEQAQTGDVMVVRVCAQFGGWKNQAK